MSESASAKKSGQPDASAFEERMARLEAIAAHLENADVPLEESVRLYKEGRDIVTRCRGQLEKARNEVTLLAADGTEAPFLADNP